MDEMLLELILSIQRKTILWDSFQLIEVLLSNNSISNINALPVEELTELIFFLNKGFVNVQAVPLPKYTDEALEEIEMTHFEEYMLIEGRLAYGYPSFYLYHGYKWLADKGANHIEMTQGKFNLFDATLKTWLKVGNLSPKSILEKLKKGQESVATVTFSSDSGAVVEFIATEKFKEYVKKEQTEEKILLEFFGVKPVKKKKRTQINPHAVQKWDYDSNDLVEWKQDNGTIRKGIVRAVIPPYTSGEDLFDRITHSESSKTKWSGEDTSNVIRLLIESPVKRGETRILEYFTYSLEHVYFVYSGKELYQNILKNSYEIFNRVNKFNVKFDPNPNNDVANATYHPESHVINVNPNYIINSMIGNWIHEDLDPFVQLEMIMVHEMGHAHPDNSKWNPESVSVVNSLEQRRQFLSAYFENPFSLHSTSLNELETYEEEIKKYISEYEKYKEIVEQLEKNAYFYGRELISNKSAPYFGVDNLESFKFQQKKMAIEKINLYNTLYRLKNEIKQKKERIQS